MSGPLVLSAGEAEVARGESLALTGQWRAAAACYEAALAVRPGFVRAWRRLGVALGELGELEAALDANRRALEHGPTDAESWCGLGGILWRMDRAQDAAEAGARALACDPACWQAAVVRANALRALDRIPEALAVFDSALAHAPDAVQLRLNRALCLLLAGDMERGWPDYEWRWRVPGHAKRAFVHGEPLWRGDDPAGKTILLHPEQGLGDTLQFCRYAPLLAARGATVVLAAPAELAPVLATLSGVSQLVGTSEPPPRFDLQCPLLSLPLAFGTTLATVPAQIPYLQAPAAKRAAWQQRLGPWRGPRIGLAWAGNPDHGNDRHRTIPLGMIGAMLPEGASLYCLQRDLRPGDVPALAARPDIAFFGADLADFADTAALAAEMDLVIAVDTAALHLAGALGLPCWGLLPTACDWRWMLGRDDSPWYPTMRLYREAGPDQWEPVLHRVRRDAEAWLRGHGPSAGST